MAIEMGESKNCKGNKSKVSGGGDVCKERGKSKFL